jgi:hypothetical protein
MHRAEQENERLRSPRVPVADRPLHGLFDSADAPVLAAR